MFRDTINHLDLAVSDPAVSEPFHRAVLGFLGFAPKRMAHGAWREPSSALHSAQATSWNGNPAQPSRPALG